MVNNTFLACRWKAVASMRKGLKEIHTPNAKKLQGDFYGSGLKQPVGTMKRDYLNGIMPAKKLKNAPKSLA